MKLICSKEYDSYLSYINQALSELKNTAHKHNFDSFVKVEFLDEVIIYDKQVDFISKIVKLYPYYKKEFLPSSISAIIENKVLYIISKEEYERVYPIEGETPLGYTRLIIHELAHQLHIRLLNDNEEGMGPRWFYEGFALHIANQFPDAKIDKKLAIDIIEHQLNVSYIDYAAIFRLLLKTFSLNELLYNINNKEMIDRIIHNYKKKESRF